MADEKKPAAEEEEKDKPEAEGEEGVPLRHLGSGRPPAGGPHPAGHHLNRRHFIGKRLTT